MSRQHLDASPVPPAQAPSSAVPSPRTHRPLPVPARTHCAAGRGRAGAAPAPGRCSPSGAAGTGAGTRPSRRPLRARWTAWPRGAACTAAAAGSPAPARCRTSPATSPRPPCTCGRQREGQRREHPAGALRARGHREGRGEGWGRDAEGTAGQSAGRGRVWEGAAFGNGCFALLSSTPTSAPHPLFVEKTFKNLPGCVLFNNFKSSDLKNRPARN